MTSFTEARNAAWLLVTNHPIAWAGGAGAVIAYGAQRFCHTSAQPSQPPARGAWQFLGTHAAKKTAKLEPAQTIFSQAADWAHKHPKTFSVIGAAVGSMLASVVTYRNELQTIVNSNLPYISQATSSIYHSPTTYWVAGFAMVGSGVGYIRSKGMKETYQSLRSTITGLYEKTAGVLIKHNYIAWGAGFGIAGLVMQRLAIYAPSQATASKFCSDSWQVLANTTTRLYQSGSVAFANVNPNVYHYILYGAGVLTAGFGMYKSAPYIYSKIKEYRRTALGAAIAISAAGIYNALSYVPESLLEFIAKSGTSLREQVPALTPTVMLGLAGTAIAGIALYKAIPYCRKLMRKNIMLPLEYQEQDLTPEQKQLRELSRTLFLLSYKGYEGLAANVVTKPGFTQAMATVTKEVTNVAVEMFKDALFKNDLGLVKNLPLDLINITKFVSAPTGRDHRATGISVLHLSVKDGDIEFTKQILSILQNLVKNKIITEAERKAFINLGDNKESTALHYAVIADSIDLAKLLINNGANPLVKDERGTLPVSYVVDNPELTAYLVDQATRAVVPASALLEASEYKGEVKAAGDGNANQPAPKASIVSNIAAFARECSNRFTYRATQPQHSQMAM